MKGRAALAACGLAVCAWAGPLAFTASDAKVAYDTAAGLVKDCTPRDAGTPGALRAAIQKYLKTVPGVSSVSDEDVRQGGSGVTIVTFE